MTSRRPGRHNQFLLAMLLALVGSCGRDAHVVARVREQTLTVEELAQLFDRQPRVRLSRELVERVATWWVEYQLFAERIASGDSLLDTATVWKVMWPQARGYILDRWRGQLFGSELPLDSASVDSVYRAGRYRLIQHVLIGARPGDATAVRARKRRQAEHLRSRLTRGLSWLEGQAQNEDAVARARDGSIGIIRAGQTAAEMEQAAFSLAPGAISPVLESRFGFHIARRPPLEEVREEYRAGVEPMVAEELDSLHMRRLMQRGRLALTGAGVEQARAAVRDPLRYLESQRVIATFDGGRFTLADVVRWLRTIPDWMHTALERGDEQTLAAFLERMIGYELLYREALEHGVTLTPLEFTELRDDLARRLDALKTALNVYPPAPGDSTSAEQRRQRAARHVDAYLSRLTGNWQGFTGVPASLAERLKRTSQWAIYPRHLERVVARVAELQAERDGRDTTGLRMD